MCIKTFLCIGLEASIHYHNRDNNKKYLNIQSGQLHCGKSLYLELNKSLQLWLQKIKLSSSYIFNDRGIHSLRASMAPNGTWLVWASLQTAVKTGGIFSKGPGPHTVMMENIAAEQRVTRTVLIHGIPKWGFLGRREKEAFYSVAADLTVCIAADGFSLMNVINSRTPAEDFPQICAPAV